MLLIASPLFAQDQVARISPMILGGGAAAAPPAGDTCGAGGMLVSAHFENSDTITTGTPAGCSVGDTTWSRVGTIPPTYSAAQYSDGGYSLYQNGGGLDSFASLTVSARDIVSEAEGKITFKIRIASDFVADYATYAIVEIRETGDDFIVLDGYRSGSVNILQIKYSRDGQGDASAATTDGLVANTWHLVTVAWKVNTSPGLSVKIDAGSAGTTALSDWSWNTTPVLFKVGQGEEDGDHMRTYYIDELKIYAVSGL